MEFVIWVVVVTLTIVFGYTRGFTGSTLTMGRNLAGSGSKTGLQDSVTPPWLTNLGLFTFLGIAVVVGVVWWWTGWVTGMLAAGMVLLGSTLLKVIFSTLLANHYRSATLQSMVSRYANYARDADTLRAEAMRHLLLKAGVDPDTAHQ